MNRGAVVLVSDLTLFGVAFLQDNQVVSPFKVYEPAPEPEPAPIAPKGKPRNRYTGRPLAEDWKDMERKRDRMSRKPKVKGR